MLNRMEQLTMFAVRATLNGARARLFRWSLLCC